MNRNERRQREPVLSARMSDVDAAFLYLERREIPLHIACVSIFEGPIPFEKFVAGVDSKLHLVPRYRQVVAAAPFNLEHPTWRDAPNFDIRRHMFRVRLKRPGGEAELEDLASRILSKPLDRRKPLWDLHIVDGLRNGRGALILRMHHALADGIAGTGILNVILDPTPEGSPPIRKPRSRPRRSREPERGLLQELGETLQGALDGLLSAETGLLEIAAILKSSGGGLLHALPELLTPVERLPFNRPCGAGRRFCWTGVPFADVQAVRAAAGGTANDVILTVVSRALARYVKLHGETVTNRMVRIVCPVNLRGANGDAALGNRISFLPVMLPLDVRDPVRNLQAVAAKMEILKNGGGAQLVGLLASCIGAAPPILQSLFWSGIPLVTLPLPLLNIICTNIPGSPVPLYAAGKRMLTFYPQVPTGHDLGVGCAVGSYDGNLFFGLTADTKAAPDVDRLRDFLSVSFDELCRAAGVKKARRPAAPAAKRKKRPRRAAAEPPPQAETGVPAAAPAPDPPPGPPDAAPSPLAATARSGH